MNKMKYFEGYKHLRQVHKASVQIENERRSSKSLNHGSDQSKRNYEILNTYTNCFFSKEIK